jgi:hypothetical protein
VVVAQAGVAGPGSVAGLVRVLVEGLVRVSERAGC